MFCLVGDKMKKASYTETILVTLFFCHAMKLIVHVWYNAIVWLIITCRNNGCKNLNLLYCKKVVKKKTMMVLHGLLLREQVRNWKKSFYTQHMHICTCPFNCSIIVEHSHTSPTLTQCFLLYFCSSQVHSFLTYYQKSEVTWDTLRILSYGLQVS